MRRSADPISRLHECRTNHVLPVKRSDRLIDRLEGPLRPEEMEGLQIQSMKRNKKMHSARSRYSAAIPSLRADDALHYTGTPDGSGPALTFQHVLPSVTSVIRCARKREAALENVTPMFFRYFGAYCMRNPRPAAWAVII